ncbi:MAG: DinB family protein [Fulvivirga sp.]|nr:DinB family protein [Fulvivirga sp.]
MNLANASKDILDQLKKAIEQINEKDFSAKVEVLNDSTIGQHTRHTLEFFLCLQKGLEKGVINYDNRDHDKIIETDKVLCLSTIEQIKRFLDRCEGNMPLQLESNYDLENDTINTVESNLHRELAYNIEHAIHHMAIIKIGLNSVAPYVKLPNHFGVAISTIKYQHAAKAN